MTPEILVAILQKTNLTPEQAVEVVKDYRNCIYSDCAALAENCEDSPSVTVQNDRRRIASEIRALRKA